MLRRVVVVLSGFFKEHKQASNHPSSSLQATMLVKVKTLTGKEIEIDIDPTDKVCLSSFCYLLSSFIHN